MATEATGWEPGMRCFTSDGREASFVAKTDGGGFVVHTVVETYDHEGETIFAEGPMVVVSEIFRKAPVEKLSADVAKLREDISSLEKQRNDLRGEVIKISAEKVRETKSLEVALEEARQFDALRGIIDRATGQFPFAVRDWERAPFADIIECQNYQFYGDEKVAELTQAAGGKLSLRLYKWAHRSSGYSSDCILATSLHRTREEAQAAVVKIMATKERCPEWLKAAEKLGIEITDADRLASHEYEMRGETYRVEQTEKAYRAAQESFRAVEARKPAPTPAEEASK